MAGEDTYLKSGAEVQEVVPHLVLHLVAVQGLPDLGHDVVGVLGRGGLHAECEAQRPRLQLQLLLLQLLHVHLLP